MLGRLQRQTFRATTIDGLCAQMTWFQSALAALLDKFSADESNDFVEQTVALNGTTVVKHKLDRVPVGWQIVDINSSARVWRSADSDNKHITLTTSGPCTVKLRVW